MLSLLGGSNRLPLFPMDKYFIGINETKKRINRFTIGYVVITDLNVSRTFREKLEKCMLTKFVPITQPLIKSTFF